MGDFFPGVDLTVNYRTPELMCMPDDINVLYKKRFPLFLQVEQTRKMFSALRLWLRDLDTRNCLVCVNVTGTRVQGIPERNSDFDLSFLFKSETNMDYRGGLIERVNERLSAIGLPTILDDLKKGVFG